MLISRRYASYAKRRSFPVAFASPSTDASVRPRLRIVSIMPGIETAAPDRTETSSGLVLSPNFLPCLLLEQRDVLVDLVHQSVGKTAAGLVVRFAHVSVVIVKPGGTGSPIEVISARLAPLPPISSFIDPSPSVLVLPK